MLAHTCGHQVGSGWLGLFYWHCDMEVGVLLTVMHAVESKSMLWYDYFGAVHLRWMNLL